MISAENSSCNKEETAKTVYAEAVGEFRHTSPFQGVAVATALLAQISHRALEGRHAGVRELCLQPWRGGAPCTSWPVHLGST